MGALKTQYEMPVRTRNISFGLMGLGLLTVLIGLFTKGMSADHHEQATFWATLMYNSIFFTLIVNASMFFVCITTLAWGGWQTSFRRVPEAISSVMLVLGPITAILLLFVVFSHNHHIYHWLDTGAVNNDPILKGKQGFLNPTFYLIWTLLTVGLWMFLGARMRKLSSESDSDAPMSFDQAKNYIWRNTVSAALFIVWFALTVGSTVPWLWMMSIDAHWYSTMYSWYTFASSFVSGMSLIALFIIFLKNKGYLEYTNEEHLHDIGKFMFAFSIFWTYLWFSQYMLIWYANIPEETVYYKHRVQGPYKGIFFLNLIINFLFPVLILMKKSAKRNYTLLAVMAVVIIFGHWLDFYQMVMGSVSKDHVTLSPFDFGVAALFVGIILFFTNKGLASRPLIPRQHPFLKESIIHHT